MAYKSGDGPKSRETVVGVGSLKTEEEPTSQRQSPALVGAQIQVMRKWLPGSGGGQFGKRAKLRLREGSEP